MRSDIGGPLVTQRRTDWATKFRLAQEDTAKELPKVETKDEQVTPKLEDLKGAFAGLIPAVKGFAKDALNNPLVKSVTDFATMQPKEQKKLETAQVQLAGLSMYGSKEARADIIRHRLNKPTNPFTKVADNTKLTAEESKKQSGLLEKLVQTFEPVTV